LSHAPGSRTVGPITRNSLTTSLSSNNEKASRCIDAQMSSEASLLELRSVTEPPPRRFSDSYIIQSWARTEKSVFFLHGFVPLCYYAIYKLLKSPLSCPARDIQTHMDSLCHLPARRTSPYAEILALLGGREIASYVEYR
jgi:hypothetical protein